jgi:O-antigen ligase
MYLTAAAFWLMYVGGVCAALVNPLAGVLVYIVVYHMNPEMQWWGESVRALQLRTSLIAALAAGTGLLIRWPRLEHGAKQFPAPFVLALLFGIIALASSTWAIDQTERGDYQAEKFVKILIMLFILIRCVRRPLHYQLVILAWIVGVAYVGYEANGGAGHAVGGRLTSGVGGPDFAESSGLATHLVATLPLIGAVFFMARSWWGRLFALATGALAVNTLVMTRTRNALAGLAVIVITGVLSLPRGYRLKGLAAVVAGTLLAVQLTDAGWWRRMQTVFEGPNEAIPQRLLLWKAALQISSDYPLGIGLGNFHQVVMDYVPELGIPRSAHNTLLACLAELGWLGLALFLAVIGSSLVRLAQTRYAARTLPASVDVLAYRWRMRFHLGWHAMALRTSLLGYLACAFFTTRLFCEDLWLLIGLTICLWNVSRQLSAQGSAEQVPASEVSPAPAVLSPLPATAHAPPGKASHAAAAH